MSEYDYVDGDSYDETVAKDARRYADAHGGTVPPVYEVGFRQSQLEQAWKSAIPRRFWMASPENVDPAVKDDLAEWLASDAPPNMVVFGPVGTGKTWAAVAAARPAFFARRGVRFCPVGEMLDGLRPGGPDGEMERLCRADILIIDDIGTERGTDWTAERMFAVVNRRWLERRPTITTSNLSVEDLTEAVGERTFSRLVGNDALVLSLRGSDRRRQRDAEIPEPPAPVVVEHIEPESVETTNQLAALRAIKEGRTGGNPKAIGAYLPDAPPAAETAQDEPKQPPLGRRIVAGGTDAHSFGDHQFCGPDCPESQVAEPASDEPEANE